MPRRSSKPAPNPPRRKRLPPAPTTPPRTSKRLKPSPRPPSTTPKKSKYFSHPPPSSSEPESSTANETSGYEDSDASASAPPSSEDGDADEDASSEGGSNGALKRRRGGVGTGRGKKGQELWRAGVKTGLGPGKQVFIPLPKAKGDGGVRYVDERIHANTMGFLGELGANNEREWLRVHDAEYRQAKADFDTFVEKLTDKIMEKDDTIPELPAKDLTFRIYRDIRFSPDPTPYKTYFSAAFSRTGRKGPYAGYYLQIAPSSSFLGAGIWHPDAAPLALLRQAIDTRAGELRNVLEGEGMRREFLRGGKGGKRGKGKGNWGDEGVVEAFVGMNAEGMLKTRPKGYPPTHPHLPLLRLRNYTIGRALSDEEVLNPRAIETIGQLVGVLVPFVRWLNGVVMPDREEGEREEEGEEEDGEEGEEEDGEEGEEEDGEEGEEEDGEEAEGEAGEQ